MSITLRQLADKLQVSPSTISRALSSEAGVSDKRAQEIRQIAEKMGYRPKPLRRRISNTVGLIICSETGQDFDDYAYQATLITEAMARFSGTGWHLYSEIVSRKDGLPQLVRENRVDGVLLCSHPTRALCDKLRSLEVPTVVLADLVNRTGLPSIMSDVGTGTETIVAHLRAMGHQKIAMIATTDNFPTVAARIEGYRQAIAEHPAIEEQLILAGCSTVQQGQIATRQLMGGVDKPTALIYATDQLAFGGMLELGRMGFDVPGDISVVGHDNSVLGKEMDPALTSVDLNLPMMIDEAVELLQAHIQNKELLKKGNIPQKTVKSDVVWRNTCGPVPNIRFNKIFSHKPEEKEVVK